MLVSLSFFPEMARLDEWSHKGKSKLYFRDFNPEQECEKAPHFLSVKPPFSRRFTSHRAAIQLQAGGRAKRAPQLPPSLGKLICTGSWHSIKMSRSFFSIKNDRNKIAETQNAFRRPRCESTENPIHHHALHKRRC